MSLVAKWGPTIKASSPRTVIVVADSRSVTVVFHYGLPDATSPPRFLEGMQKRVDGILGVIKILDKSINWREPENPSMYVSGHELVLEIERNYYVIERAELEETIRAICHRAGWKVVLG